MLYEHALTTGAFESFGDGVDGVTSQALLQVLHGVRENGLLANLYNGEWWARVWAKKNGMPAKVCRQIQELLRILYDRGLVVPRAKEGPTCPRNDREWLAEAIRSHYRLPLHSIITRNSSVEAWDRPPQGVVSLEGVLLSDIWNTRQRTWRVRRTASDFARALQPVLATSRAITLIDKMIGLRLYRGNLEFARFLEVVDTCACPAKRRLPLDTLEIHTLDDAQIPDTDYHDIVRKVSKHLPQIERHCGKRRLIVWEERPRGKRFHNRRVLTNHAGISCPWGLDIFDTPGVEPGDDEWALLDYEARVAIARDFQPNTSPYTFKMEVPW